jgi:hypothetical protein
VVVSVGSLHIPAGRFFSPFLGTANNAEKSHASTLGRWPTCCNREKIETAPVPKGGHCYSLT